MNTPIITAQLLGSEIPHCPECNATTTHISTLKTIDDVPYETVTMCQRCNHATVTLFAQEQS